MKFLGEEFYKHFFCRFQEYVHQNRKAYNRAEKDFEWTSFVKDGFLSELAKNLGFEQIQKEGIYAIDLTWEKPSEGISVVIEHENDIKSIWKREVPNLLKTAAPLKVLITYVDDTEFPGKEIAQRLFNCLKDANFSREFLLILGSDSMKEPSDWVGFLYKPELTYHSVIFCSNILQAESSPGKKAAKTRKARLLRQKSQKGKIQD
jgi:hypothetical protein